ncbi:MAG: hypothetical protein GF311_25135 [Candidatus Lokiarchaeota archaeon]|nr:hypothetical protein [Candidatus Lokiarchaeota archaeon]
MVLNCWDIMNCGKNGLCPASKEVNLDGIHNGLNGGRACWVVKNTECGDEIQPNFTLKFGRCKDCEVYTTVMEEEGDDFKGPADLMRILYK